MRCLRTVLVITTIIVSFSTRIRSQDESEEIGPDQFGGAFGAGLNCPPGVDKAFQDCNEEAKKFWIALGLEQSTGHQVCGYRNQAMKCSGVFNGCRSQKAQVLKSVTEEGVKIKTGLYYDCETLQRKHDSPSAGGECYPEIKVPEFIKETSQSVSSSVDYTAKDTFAEHCRNRDSAINCFSNLDDSCNAELAHIMRAAFVGATQKAYARFNC